MADDYLDVTQIPTLMNNAHRTHDANISAIYYLLNHSTTHTFQHQRDSLAHSVFNKSV